MKTCWRKARMMESLFWEPHCRLLSLAENCITFFRKMELFKVDLHTHTVLSPCGDLEMSPRNIVARASAKGIHILGITDHNSTRQCQVLQEAAKPYNLMILAGAEVTSKEEAHCLAFFQNQEQLAEFQLYLDAHLPNVPNEPNRFGYQVVVNLEDD